ncbi:nudix-type nucleoside diphosphatase (YffH/AdpP family) [Rhizobium sp. SG_E_25_P2]|uniref:NUDIX domain-containing protein n=1 Tax=Rhizobium sp. SG_E_25_P2 TaxID=2879942 RepID=UPI002474CFB4|nr:NUDIX domain-containing protein [Rhizobium sp. SG_E_25_P2]MDH6266751.1 nudix-type nucleoside diphosphatase (YffH/AdpP family) [Rhizobium sp. SG_E_25_P2]
MDAKPSRKVDILNSETLYKRFVHLQRLTVEHETLKGGRQTLSREIHDHGNAATILLYDPARKSVILVRQLRVPPVLNGDDGWLIETPAGLLDGDDPLSAIIREAMEETGYRIDRADYLYDAYMSPGTLTERVSFFAAEIDVTQRQGEGGGLEEEGEDIEILEIPLKEAFEMISAGKIVDGKTIMLLQWAVMTYGL